MKPVFPGVCTLHGVFAQGRVQPEIITIFKHWTRLTTDNHGEMSGNPLEGFFCAESQLISRYLLTVNGSPVVHRFSAQLSSNEWASTGVVLSAGEGGNLAAGTIPKGTLEVKILRKIDQGMAELICIRNNGQPKQKIDLRLNLTCPIRDVEFAEEMKQEEKSTGRGLRPKIYHHRYDACIRFKKNFGPRRTNPPPRNEDRPGHPPQKKGDLVIRALDILVSVKNSTLGITRHGLWDCGVEIRVQSELQGRGEVNIELRYEPIIDGIRMGAAQFDGLSPLPRAIPRILANAIEFDSGNSALNLIVGQAQVDLESLQLPVFGSEPEQNPERDQTAFIAGVPRYLGLFGRDTVIAARQSALFAPHYLNSSLTRLAALQGDCFDPWRDEEPNRLPHEQRLDPMSVVGKLNRDIYYGDVTSTPYWVLSLCTLYHWTGDIGLLQLHRETLDRCCQWILWRLEQGEGFIYYEPHSPKSGPPNRNQAWKDSGDAIVDEQGRVCVPPLALIEIQGYAYQALVEASRLFHALGSSSYYLLLLEKAQALKTRFYQKFWLNKGGFYALALDRMGVPIRTKASNAGHCLGTGILHPESIPKVVNNLLAPDMFSGWGIRTLSATNPAFDPLSYHRGAVWPVENAIIAEGMSLVGFREEANQIITGQLGLAALFQHMRLPEVFGGQERSESSPVPGIYSFANMLQAWSVSAVSQFITTILGFHPRVDQGKVFINPHLPEWLPRIELKKVKLGRSQLDVRAERATDGTTAWDAKCAGVPIEVISGDARRAS